ncbi:unnamed protein product, partial [Lampetra planeri]
DDFDTLISAVVKADSVCSFVKSGPKTNRWTPNKKAYLQRKLDSKLKDMASQRKVKNKEKDG